MTDSATGQVPVRTFQAAIQQELPLDARHLYLSPSSIIPYAELSLPTADGPEVIVTIDVEGSGKAAILKERNGEQGRVNWGVFQKMIARGGSLGLHTSPENPAGIPVRVTLHRTEGMWRVFCGG